VALARGADDPNAPLANTKEQLQLLKKDESARKNALTGETKLDLPGLKTTGQGLDLPAPTREQDEPRKDKNANKSWLLDGFDQLDKKRSGNSNDAHAGKKNSKEEKPLDPSDPDYFLRVYERQRADGEASRADAKLSTNQTSGAAASANDPMAPFMKEWLANSPVRDALREAQVSGASASASDQVAMPVTTGPQTEHVFAPMGSAANDPARSAAANPFVQALGLPSDVAKSADFRPPPLEAARPLAPVRTETNTIYDLPERAKTDLKQTLPPPPSEDKKYFPQLKKF
jgi:hypothetical protein